MKFRQALIAALLALGPTSALAAKASDVDIDGDKVISSREFALYWDQIYGAELKVPLSIADSNRDGMLDASEVAKANEILTQIQKKTEARLVEFAEDYPNGMPIKDFAEAYATSDLSEVRGKTILENSGLLIREDHESIDFGTAAKKRSKAKAATLSFTRNEKADESAFAFKGALMRPFFLDRDGDKSNEWAITPSLYINYLDNEDDDKKDVETLEVRLGITRELDLAPVLDGGLLYVRASPVYTTDLSLESDIPSIQLELEPLILGTGMGTQKDCFIARCRWQPVLHFEYGKVVEDSEDERIETTFQRLGPKFGIDLYPTWISKRIALNFAYNYLYALNEQARDRKYFSAALTFNLDEGGNYKLEGKYTNGDSTVKLENEESWLIGLGVLF